MSEPQPTPSPAPAAPPLSKWKIFLRRLFSSVLLWSVVLAGLFFTQRTVADYVFLGIMLAIAALGLNEFYDLVRKRDLVCFKTWGMIGGLLLMTSTFIFLHGGMVRQVFPAKANDFESGILIIFVLGLCLRQFMSKLNQQGILAISMTLFGLMYVPWLLNFMQKINFFPDVRETDVEGNWYILYFILVTKFSDLGAYVVGSLIGRHKMIPRISPGKTWEGFGGAVVVSTLVSVVFTHFAGHHLYGMNFMHAIILGVILSMAAVVGDLIESAFKREAGVKDSGKFFPGIGGMLDLMDSLLFNAPLMYLYLRHVLTH